MLGGGVGQRGPQKPKKLEACAAICRVNWYRQQHTHIEYHSVWRVPRAQFMHPQLKSGKEEGWGWEERALAVRHKESR